MGKHFNNFFLTATESYFKSDKVKTSILLTCIGSKGREIYETFLKKVTQTSIRIREISHLMSVN